MKHVDLQKYKGVQFEWFSMKQSQTNKSNNE